MRTPPEMTPAEFEMMKALWRLKKGTVAEVRDEHARLCGTDLAYTTVMTLLGRLASKGAVACDKTRQPYVYKPAFRRESVLRERLRHFLADVFEGDADSLILHLVEDEALSVDELRRLQKKLNKKDREP